MTAYNDEISERDANDPFPSANELQSEFKATLRFLKSGSARITVPQKVARNYLSGQLVNVVIQGSVGPVVVV